eukprot:357323-Chlamydomonas_euryale.AAC.3
MPHSRPSLCHIHTSTPAQAAGCAETALAVAPHSRPRRPTPQHPARRTAGTAVPATPAAACRFRRGFRGSTGLPARGTFPGSWGGAVWARCERAQGISSRAGLHHGAMLCGRDASEVWVGYVERQAAPPNHRSQPTSWEATQKF